MTNLLIKLKPKRRWFQFSMRTMLVVLSVLCVGLSLWVVPAERRRRAVAAIEVLGGEVTYASDEATSDSFPVAFLRRWLPQAYVDEVAIIELSSTEVTDIELSHLQGLTGLQVLLLGDTQITDAGLADLEGLTGLDWLMLDNTSITDAGLVHLKGLADLRVLGLDNTRVTDAGLSHLKGLTGLQSLHLTSTRVTDAGLIHITGLTGLQGLCLGYTQFTDSGLCHLKGLTDLQSLNLASTRVTDAGWIHLREMTGLKLLYLSRTQVTDAGASQLREALPKCEIVGPFGRRDSSRMKTPNAWRPSNQNWSRHREGKGVIEGNGVRSQKPLNMPQPSTNSAFHFPRTAFGDARPIYRPRYSSIGAADAA